MTDKAPPPLDPDVAWYYDNAPEESRLESGTSQLEKLRTCELILRFAPSSPATVIDIGGAAGGYAFWLAEKGYKVRLIDASPRLVEIARSRNAQSEHPLESCAVGDARALDEPDSSADVVLLLGPLYHLVDMDDRQTALREARRVLRPGGVVLAAAISRWASALDGMSREYLSDDEFASVVDKDLADGRHRNPARRLEYFTTAYFHLPEELGAEISRAGFDLDGVFGIEGPGWILPDFDERWQDEGRRSILVKVARKLESEPAVIGCSAHLLAVGRKRDAARE